MQQPVQHPDYVKLLAADKFCRASINLKFLMTLLIEDGSGKILWTLEATFAKLKNESIYETLSSCVFT